MSRLLLDTHVFLWWAQANSQIRAQWIQEIVDDSNSVHVSAVTAWEIETKKRIKKLDFDDDVSRVATEFGFEPLAITIQHASLAGKLDWDHRDPFDRMLAAQALSDEMVLLSADDAMKSAPGVRVL
jgi:PIN domain nuclease of toxin-antitoxin system